MLWMYSKLLTLFSDGEKVSDYEMKLMDLDTEHLGIPVSSRTVLLLKSSDTFAKWLSCGTFSFFRRKQCIGGLGRLH